MKAGLTQAAVDILTDEAIIQMVNTMLAGATPKGAYYIGLAHGRCALAGMRPDVFLFEVVRTAKSASQAILHIEEWIADERQPRRRMALKVGTDADSR